MRTILYLNIFFTSLLFVVRESVCEFKAISRPEWLGNLYLSLRGEGEIGRPPYQEEINQKRICNEIASSKFWIEKIVPDDMWATLNHKKYRHIFDELYRKKTETTSSPFPTLGLRRKLKESDYYYSNPYTTREVVFEKLEVDRIKDSSSDEHVFLCVLKNKQTQDVEAWYVSREYASNENVPVRFIFHFQEAFTGGMSLNLRLLAEEPAKVIEDPDLGTERYYLNLKKDHQEEPNTVLDPLCEQTRQYGQNSRFCSCILSSDYFDDKIDHLISNVHLQNQCIERKIDFQAEDVKKEAEGQSFRERVILCEAKMIDTNSKKYFYISRAYASGQAFLFSSVTFHGHVELVKRFTNVSLHDDSSQTTDAEIEEITSKMS